MSCRSQLKKTEAKLERAMGQADKHGYTGMVNSRGSLFDYPPVKKLMKKLTSLQSQCRR